MANNSNNGHAILSPSGASRWMACTPSALLEQQFEDRAGEAAAEGTLAHAIAELLIKREAGKITPYKYAIEVTPLLQDKLYSNEMMSYVEDYAGFVIERFNEARALVPDAELFTEVKLPLELLTGEKDAEGTSDSNIVSDETLEVIDLKYGKGVRVEAENNKQMALYGLAALLIHRQWYDIKRVKMTIYQPRMDNFSSWVITVEELLHWAETELKPAAKNALAGSGDFVVGDHCHFCRAMPVCKAHSSHQLEVAKYDFLDPVLLQDTEVVDVLNRAKSFEGWLKAVKEYALQQAVLNGKKWPDMKLVEGMSKRKYTDEDKIIERLNDAGFKNEDILKVKLLGLTELTGFIGKAQFTKLVTPYVIKPPGKPTLVPISDKRDELDSLEAARADFKIEADTEE